jgi:hypothetical protein
MGYKLNNSIKIDLSKLGDNNGVPFFVQMKNPKLLTYDEKMKFAAAGKDLIGADGKANLNQENTNKMGEVALSYVTAWNLIDIESGDPVSSTDEGVIKKIPGEVIETIMEQIGSASKQDEETKN